MVYMMEYKKFGGYFLTQIDRTSKKVSSITMSASDPI